MKLGSAAFLKISLFIMPFFLAGVVFTVVYLPAESLPILADGAHHAQIIEEIVQQQGVDIQTKAYYPLFYHVFGATVYSFFGLSGVKAIGAMAIALSGLIAYLIARKLTKNEFVALFSIPLIGFSPLLIRYGSIVYIEPVMLFFFLASVYAIILYYERQEVKTAVFACLMVAGAIATKQQMLFLLFALPLFLLLNRVKLRKIAVGVMVVMLLAFGWYADMWSRVGALVQPPDVDSVLIKYEKDFSIWRVLWAGRFSHIEPWSRELEVESNGFATYLKGTGEHEARHVWFKDLIHKEDFLKLHFLYPSSPTGGGARASFQLSLLQLLFLTGLLMAIFISVRDRRWRIIPIIMAGTYIMLPIGSDTQRYFCYLPPLLSIAYLLPVTAAAKYLKNRRAGSYMQLGLVILVTVTLLSYIAPVASQAQTAVRSLKQTQTLGDSRGG